MEFIHDDLNAAGIVTRTSDGMIYRWNGATQLWESNGVMAVAKLSFGKIERRIF